MNTLETIMSRKSVRKFTPNKIPREDLTKILEAGIQAPSAKNKQNWHFVVVENTDKINAMAEAINTKATAMVDGLEGPEVDRFKRIIPYCTVFKNAPTVLVVYSSAYHSTGADILSLKGAPQTEMDELLKATPGIQNIGAAVENILLAAHAMGYGGCWMTAPCFASKEINQVLDFDNEKLFMACIVALGEPEGDSKSPARKPLEEVTTFID